MAMRWPGPRTNSRPSATAFCAAALLHLAACVFLLTFVQLPVAPAPLDDHAVALVFAPAQSARAELPAVPTVTATTPSPAPEPPAPPEVPDAAVQSPVVPEPPARSEASEPPAVPSLSPTVDALTQPPVPPPPLPDRQPPPKPKPNKPPRMATASPPHTAPAAPTRRATAPAAAQPVPSNVSREEASAQTTSPSAPIAPAATAPAPIGADWQHELSGWLAAHKTYPDEARRRGEQGGVVLRFTVDRSGKVLDVKLVSSSFSPRLDDAAQAILRNASLPPFPATMPQERITVTMQIKYRLTD
jgi:protein TonB